MYKLGSKPQEAAGKIKASDVSDWVDDDGNPSLKQVIREEEQSWRVTEGGCCCYACVTYSRWSLYMCLGRSRNVDQKVRFRIISM